MVLLYMISIGSILYSILPGNYLIRLILPYLTMPRGQSCWRLGLVMYVYLKGPYSLVPKLRAKYNAQRPVLLEAGA